MDNIYKNFQNWDSTRKYKNNEPNYNNDINKKDINNISKNYKNIDSIKK